MCKLLKVSSLLGLLAFCAAEGMQINASSESNATGKPGTRAELEIGEPLTFEIKERMLKLTNLNDGTATNYKEDEISELIDKGLVGQLKFNDGRVEYFTGENIPDSRFKGDTSLESIVIPPTVKIIGNSAFEGCLQLQEVIFTEGSQLQKIGAWAFSGTAIERITIPNSVERIENSAFRECSQLQEVILGSQLQTIGTAAFALAAIKEITIPNSVEIIGYGAFYQCLQLQEVIFTKGSHLQKIEEDAFSGTAIKEITIPNSVERIGGGAFNECRQLQEVILGSQLREIGDYAFLNAAIKEITIPETVKEIGSGAFSGNQLNKVVFLGDPSKMHIAQDAFPGNVTRVYSNDSKE